MEIIIATAKIQGVEILITDAIATDVMITETIVTTVKKYVII